MPRTSASHPALGSMMVFGSCLSLSFGAALAGHLFEPIGAWGVTALRLGISAVVMLVIVRPDVRGWDRRQWRAAILFGLALGGMNAAFYAAIERIPLGPAVAIEFLGPLVLSALLTRRLRDAAWIVLALVGIVLLGVDGMLGAEALDPVGVVFALVAATLWALYIRATAHAGSLIPGNDALAVALGIAAVLMLPFGIPAAAVAAADPALILFALGTAVLGSVIPYTLELAALRRIPQRVFSILVSLEPATATLAGFLLLGQHASPVRLAAIAFVIAASVGVSVAAGRRRGDAPLSAPAAP